MSGENMIMPNGWNTEKNNDEIKKRDAKQTQQQSSQNAGKSTL